MDNSTTAPPETSSSAAAASSSEAVAASAAQPTSIKTEEKTVAAGIAPPSSSNAAAAAPIKSEETSAAVAEENEEEPEDEFDEEDNLFTSIETSEATAEHGIEQPHDATAAPKLLQSAIAKGEVGVDDSEAESEEGRKKSPEKPAATAASAAAGAEEKKEDGDQQQHHTHHRNSQLDFLLNRAKEYSDFISNDIQELQEGMQAEALAAAAKADKKNKKSKQDSGKKKKRKKNNGEPTEGEMALGKAQETYSKSKAAAATKPIFIQPKNLANGCTLKDYQLEGVRWLVSLYENGVSGILADEMGLGKTIQVIALIAHLRTRNVSGPFIVVAPLATLPNWIREFEKWLPSVPVCRFHGSAQDRDAMLEGPLNKSKRKNADYPVIVTSYEVAIRDEKRLNKIGEFTFLVVDEGQRLKNHRCTLISSLKRIRAANRLLLSGTPIQSHGASTAEDILKEERKNQTVTKLHDILRPFLLRRIKKDVLKDMPPKKEIVVYAGMSKLQDGYSKMIDQGILRDILLKQGIEAARTLSQTNKQMNHRKNCNHPFMFGEPIDPATGAHMGTAHPQLLVRASGKFALLDRMLERLFRDKHQVLIFSQMTSLLNVIEDYLLYRQWNYCRIDGTTKIDERQRQMDVFNAEKTGGVGGTRNDGDDRHFVFLLSTRAGGLGINLATADTCIIFDSDWNPHQDSQAMDRCHRIGQNRPVAVYRLLTVNSVDIDMMEKQISKKKLERMAIVGGDFRKAGSRSKGEFKTESLNELLESDVKDLQLKGTDVESIRIDDEEFEFIMNRKKLFGEGGDAIPTEGKMYDVIEGVKGDMLGAMNA
eukprot:scaffold23018_cov205-Skeletonema_marinoi.AAC.2